jgi:hypothetical protein
MGSTRFTRIALPLSILALAVSPAVASGMPVKDYSQNGATGDFVQQRTQHIYKDYSRNGATGDFAPATATPAPVTPVAVHEQSSFSWGAALLGAGATLLLILLVAVTSRQVRRRRIPAPSPARPTTV